MITKYANLLFWAIVLLLFHDNSFLPIGAPGVISGEIWTKWINAITFISNIDCENMDNPVLLSCKLFCSFCLAFPDFYEYRYISTFLKHSSPIKWFHVHVYSNKCKLKNSKSLITNSKWCYPWTFLYIANVTFVRFNQFPTSNMYWRISIN